MTSPGNKTCRTRARFIERLNRFVARVKIDGSEKLVYVPNTGRLGELLLPGCEVVLEPQNGKYLFRIQYVMYKDNPVIINSTQANDIFQRLLSEKKVPGMENYNVKRREPACGNNRFDFELISPKKRNIMMELKSCTLAWNDTASFPDAVSSRATEHVHLLSQTQDGMLIFMLMHQGVKTFVPNYHTDFEFYRALKKHRADLNIRAFSAKYNDGLDITGLDEVTVHIPEAEPRGSYILIFHSTGKHRTEIGSLGLLSFTKGYYCYAGSGMNNLFKRINRHRLKRKKLHWHVDYLSSFMKAQADLPIVGTHVTECSLARLLRDIGGSVIRGFGSTDCSCEGHLFYMRNNPLHNRNFWDSILELRYKGFSGLS